MFPLNIQKSISLYRDVFYKTLDPSAIFDKNGNIDYINKALSKINGYNLKELKGKPTDILVFETERSKIENIVGEVLKDKRTFRNLDTFLKTKNEKKIPVVLTVIPLLEKEKLVGGLIVFVDTRQLQGLLESLGRAKSELEKRVKERTKELQDKTMELEKAKERLEESKNILEIKVKARTRELRELNESLEENVKERTKELREKLDELNKWYKLTVGRELRMIELKREIGNLRKKKKEN